MKKQAMVLFVLLSIGFCLPTLAVAAPAKDEDVASIDAILKAVYDVISGEAGEKRDWGRFKSLFIGEAQLMPANQKEDGTGMRYSILSPESYEKMAGTQLVEEGFFEKEIHRVVEQFGPIAHVFSTYEARRTLSDEKPFVRGINSFQLFNDGKRWWVVSIYWTAEREDLPIPDKYLP
jgi:hypothetical protein